MLASAVLISRKPFENKTLTELKAELRDYGLSTAGRKSDLVARAYYAALLSASRPLSDSSSPASKSTKPTLPREHTSSGSADAAPRPLGSLPKIDHTSINLSGFDARPTKAKYPGMPSEIILPFGGPGPVEAETPIPLISSSSATSPHAAAIEHFVLAPRQILSTSNDALLHSSGSHSFELGPAPHLQDVALGSNRGPGNPRTREEIQLDAAHDQATAAGVTAVVSGAVNSLLDELTSSFESAPFSTQGGPEPFKFTNRPLNEPERNGLIRLAGILVGGWILGGLDKKSKSKSH